MTKLSERFCAVDCDAPLWAIEEVIKLEEEIERLRADRDSFYMDYRIKCDEETKQQAVEINLLRADAERYKWIFCNCEVTYYKNDLPFATESELDAAMKEAK